MESVNAFKIKHPFDLIMGFIIKLREIQNIRGLGIAIFVLTESIWFCYGPVIKERALRNLEYLFNFSLRDYKCLCFVSSEHLASFL